MTGILFLHTSWNESTQSIMGALSRNSSIEKTAFYFSSQQSFHKLKSSFCAKNIHLFSPNTKFTGFLSFFLSLLPELVIWGSLNHPFYTNCGSCKRELWPWSDSWVFSIFKYFFAHKWIKYVELELFWQQRKLRCFFRRVIGTAWRTSLAIETSVCLGCDFEWGYATRQDSRSGWGVGVAWFSKHIF